MTNDIPESWSNLRPHEQEALMEIAVMPEDERTAIIDYGKMDPDLRQCMVEAGRNYQTVRNVASKLLRVKPLVGAAVLIWMWMTGLLGTLWTAIASHFGPAAATAAAAVITWETLT